MDSIRSLGVPPLFDPAAGQLVAGPPGDGPGFWAGAPSALRDPADGRFYLSYRLRRPLQEGRGGATRIAAGDDGVRFQTIWEATREQFDSPSIERCCLVKVADGLWRLYASYVDGATGKWRIDLLEAPAPAQFDPRRRRKVLTADDVDSEGVKDPYVLRVGPGWLMFVPYGPRSSVAAGASPQAMHGTAAGNVFATGLIAHPTGLAVSADGVTFRWLGDAVPPGGPGAWDRSVARVSCVVYRPPVFAVFYDGRTGEGDVYEDKTGCAISLDLRTFTKVTAGGPLLRSPYASGCLRYLEAVHLPDEQRILYYYEMARPDGAHELRVSAAALTG
jgi:hypothetical protein